MHSNCMLLPDHIVCKITQRNNIRRVNPCDLALKLLNEELTSEIQKHKQNLWKEHFDAHWDHRHTIHILWKTIHGLSNRAPPPTGSKRHSLQAVQLSHRTQAAVHIVSNFPAPSNGAPIYRFLGMPVMRTRWMAGAAAHKSGWCRDQSRSDNFKQTSLDL